MEQLGLSENGEMKPMKVSNHSILMGFPFVWTSSIYVGSGQWIEMGGERVKFFDIRLAGMLSNEIST